MFLQPPREPPPAIKEAAASPEGEAEHLRDALVAAGTLIRKGTDFLHQTWDRLPRIRVELLRQGLDLEADLARLVGTHVDRGRQLATFLLRCGRWGVEVQLLRSQAFDTEPAAFDTEKFLATLQNRMANKPDGTPPDTREVADAVLLLARTMADGFRTLGGDVTELKTDVAELKTDVAELKTDVAELKTDVAELKTDVAELKTDVAELKTDQAELKTDVAELREGQIRIEGRVGHLTGEHYERKFRERLPDLVYMGCHRAGLPQPAGIELRWTDRPDVRQQYGLAEWEDVWRDLNLPDPVYTYGGRLKDCDFIYAATWNETWLPDLLLVGETSITIDEHVLKKAAGHRRDLEDTGHQVRVLLAGAGFTRRVEEQGGPSAVANTGVAWLARSENLNHSDWQDPASMVDLLREWHGRLPSPRL